MHVSKIIILYSLNLYSAVCQLYFNTTGRKKKSNILLNVMTLLKTARPPFYSQFSHNASFSPSTIIFKYPR